MFNMSDNQWAVNAHQQCFLSTAGAVPVRNEKGELSMKKVKVTRYISGKRPNYARYGEHSSSEDEEEFIRRQKPPLSVNEKDNCGAGYHESSDEEENAELVELENSDARLRRLKESIESGCFSRSRGPEEDQELELHHDRKEGQLRRAHFKPMRRRHEESDSDSNVEEEENEEEAEIRRACIRNRLLQKQEEEVLEKVEGNEIESDELSDSEYELYTESDEDEAFPRLKPVFVRKEERLAVKDKDDEDAVILEGLEKKKRKEHETRRKETLKLIETEIEKSRRQPDETYENEHAFKISDVKTDDELDETDYEAWKVRELKRIKRDQEERAAYEKERMEMERMRNLTEDERRLERMLQPKQISNQAMKGKYRYLQKYYHRGSFYLDKEEKLLKRDVSLPTLEDQFDKSVLPQVMQVKNFGRNGRTKYTHLRDQDTSDLGSVWTWDTHHNIKFHCEQAAGLRQRFEKPSRRKVRRVVDDLL
ncbi:unnamed protein product [Orchesella dallaii]|uniref:Micro-fibrillar-associated protein 1 C-terminal domain-containing protein n=1 Tax=Orchesella dallaii TaxID=48710 RepID=A0ABP1R859_9HEXA